MKNIFKTSRLQKTFYLIAFLWLFAGGQIVLFVSRIQGVWFESFYSVFTSLALLITIFSSLGLQERFSIKFRPVISFFFLLLSIFVPVSVSKQLYNGNPYALKHLMMLIPMVLASGLWGAIFYENWFDEKNFFRICISMLIFSNFFLYKHYSTVSLSVFRVGEEANPIGLSYAIAYLWIFLISGSIMKMQFYYSLLFSVLAPINIFIMSTRQTLIFIFISIFLLWFFYIKNNIKEFPKIGITSKREKTQKPFLILFFILFIGIIYFFVVNFLEINEFFNATFQVGLSRWLVFFESYSASGRVLLFQKAYDAWVNNMFLGDFFYHKTPGSYAHHMLMDFFAQYGLVGGISYLLLIIFALKQIFITPKKNMLSMSFSAIFLGLIFIGMTVTRFTLNPIFHFLLFYWVAFEEKERGRNAERKKR